MGGQNQFVRLGGQNQFRLGALERKKEIPYYDRPTVQKGEAEDIIGPCGV